MLDNAHNLAALKCNQLRSFIPVSGGSLVVFSQYDCISCSYDLLQHQPEVLKIERLLVIAVIMQIM